MSNKTFSEQYTLEPERTPSIYGQKYCVILNGPPGCGKDTLGKQVVRMIDSGRRMSCKQQEFKEALRECTCKVYGLTLNEYTRMLFDDRVLKETPHDMFAGLTPRKALQYVSEKVIKPHHGRHFFGLMALREVMESKVNLHVFTDGGFQEEADMLMKECKVLVVQLSKEGTSFEGDTRSYVDGNVTIPMVVTEGHISENAAELYMIINQFIKGVN